MLLGGTWLDDRFRILRRDRDRGTNFRDLGSGINIVTIVNRIVTVSLIARNAIYNTAGRPLTVSTEMIPLVQ